jgi:hypothetical protein
MAKALPVSYFKLESRNGTHACQPRQATYKAQTQSKARELAKADYQSVHERLPLNRVNCRFCFDMGIQKLPRPSSEYRFD